MLTSRARIAVVAVAGLALASGLYAQDISQIKVETTPLGNNVYMLAAAGGNLGLLVGDDGALLVDAEYGQLNDKVVAAIKAITDKPVRLLVNTHWHFDHVGGNESFAKAGTLIIAQ
jgi:cyclase